MMFNRLCHDSSASNHQRYRSTAAIEFTNGINFLEKYRKSEGIIT